MKNLLSSIFFVLFFLNLSAQTIDPANQKLIEAFVKSHIEVGLEEVDQATVNKVFSGTFYKVNVDFIVKGHDVSSHGGDTYINVNGSSLNIIDQASMSADCPVLLSLIKKDFLFKDENTAKLFEAALNVLYPVDQFETEHVKHLHKAPEWIFIRSKFFDNYKAFIVTTDTDGVVTKIEVTLGYPRN